MKNEIRKKLLNLRKNFSIKDIHTNSYNIKKKIFKMDEFNNANTILFYISYNNEVFTHDLIKDSFNHKKRIIVPISDKKNLKLDG